MLPFRRKRKTPDEELLSRKRLVKVEGLKLKKLRIKRDKKNKAEKIARRFNRRSA